MEDLQSEILKVPMGKSANFSNIFVCMEEKTKNVYAIIAMVKSKKYSYQIGLLFIVKNVRFRFILTNIN